jgi:hypothetical protein
VGALRRTFRRPVAFALEMIQPAWHTPRFVLPERIGTP